MRLLILSILIPAVWSLAPLSLAARAETAAASPPGLTGAKALPLTGERRAAFEAYVANALDRFDVPGAEVAVVQNGEVVYLNGFGVKEMGGTEPVTADTLMMIGSITKSMTSMMAAALVDKGHLGWDTRLIDILPDFAIGDPALTARLTVRDAFCNCSGVPGLNLESYFLSDRLTPETVVKALAGVKPAAEYGKEFIYNNFLVASGGYALGVAHGGGLADLGRGFDVAFRELVLGPIGMKRSTFDTDAVLAGGDYALPHAVDLSGDQRPMPLAAEGVLMPYRPAGALWSNAREMARYLQTVLAGGVAPGGARVVSAENLARTWDPGVSVPNLYGGPPQMEATRDRYGLGWLTGGYHGLRVVSIDGGTGGYAAEIALLPEADFGIVILTNAFALSPRSPIPLAFEYAVQLRLFELLFGKPAEFDAELQAQEKVVAAGRPEPALGKVEADAVGPYLGRYDNPTLGAVSLSSRRSDQLVLNAGNLATELRPAADATGGTAYFLHDPPLSLFSQAYGVMVKLTGGADDPRMTITVPASVTGPEEEFVFTRRR